MKAVVLTANAAMEVQELPLPALAAGHCRVRVANVGVCSSDIQRACGNGAYFYPLVMGHELAGEIAEVGAGVKGFKTGDRVTVFPLLPCFTCGACACKAYAQCRDYSYYGSRAQGAYAECIDVKEWNLLHVPDGVSLADAATCEPSAVVLHALNRARLLETREPKKIAILGAGFLGLIMVQILHRKAPQHEVHLIDRNRFKLEIGAAYARHTEYVESEAAWQAYLKQCKGFDVVVEASGVAQTFAYAIAMTAHGGTTLWMGNITADLTLPKALVSAVLRKELSVLGTWNSDFPADWNAALKLMQEGLKPSALVTHWITLAEVPDILTRLHRHKCGQAKFEMVKAMVGRG